MNIDFIYKLIQEQASAQIASGMKRVVQLVVENFDKHVQEKLRLIISEEVDQKCDFKIKEIFDSLEF